MFTYKCGDLNWGSGATIGFSAAGDLFANHAFAGRRDAHEVDCLNQPASDYVNVIYAISSIAAIPPPIKPDTGMYIHIIYMLGSVCRLYNTISLSFLYTK